MTTAGEQIRNAARAISENIDAFDGRRDLLSTNVLQQLRNLVEGTAVRIHTASDDATYDYDAITAAIAYMKAQGKLRVLARFHAMLQASASHYTVDGDSSERLMLKYYEHLLRTRDLLRAHGYSTVLANLESFPTDLDPSLREYHEAISQGIQALTAGAPVSGRRDRFYIHKTMPFFVGGRIYYEVTFTRATNRPSKFDRVIAFTDIDLDERHAAMLTTHEDQIHILGQDLPVTIITEWSVSIRPCEFDNFARLLGADINVRSNHREYQAINEWLTAHRGTLLDLVDLPNTEYDRVRSACTAGLSNPRISPVLDHARDVIRGQRPGSNMLRYLLLRMRNDVLKPQHYWQPCPRLSNLHLSWGCIPFDQMPFCSFPIRHLPRYWDLVEALDATGRDHELLARRVMMNVETRGTLYTPRSELEPLGDVDHLIHAFNANVYYKHERRKLIADMDHVVIRGYEDDTAAIVTKIQDLSSSGVAGHRSAVESWLAATPRAIDDPTKEAALKDLFSASCVALVYGSAGTGKSTMVNHIATYFNTNDKLFLAHTNPAVDNLRRKVTAQKSEFATISRHLHGGTANIEYDLLVIDECSTVSNEDLLAVLTNTRFKLLVLVGDVYQIEAIQFGNWFAILPSFIPDTSVFELTTPYRTSNPALLEFWSKIRALDDTADEAIAHAGYSTDLDQSLFEPPRSDEIILCLNYDGLYGINNTNRFLQASNTGQSVTIGVSTYKVGDPILFNETRRFRPLIYNNVKGAITGIRHFPGRVEFDVELLDVTVTELDVHHLDLERLDNSTVRFSVYDADTTDADADDTDSAVPFQVAYAVSIHKAQGLEYNSVKIVITNANENDITHSILYTAVTRARDRLRIYWTPETQQTVLSQLVRGRHEKEVALLSARHGLTPRRKPRKLH